MKNRIIGYMTIAIFFFGVGFVLHHVIKNRIFESKSCKESRGISVRSFATARIIKEGNNKHWAIEIKSYNGNAGYYLLKKMVPALDGIRTPSLIFVTDKSNILKSVNASDSSIEIESSDSFAEIEGVNDLPWVDGIYPVVGNSEIIQIPGNSIGRVSHLVSDGMTNAIDIKAPLGAVVRSIRPGKVVYVEQRFPDSGCDAPELLRAGNKIIVVDQAGVEIVYGHLMHMSSEVSEGEHVAAGQPLAKVGNSGKSVVPHLHLHAGGLTLSGYRTVPLRFFSCDHGRKGIQVPSLGARVCI